MKHKLYINFSADFGVIFLFVIKVSLCDFSGYSSSSFKSLSTQVVLKKSITFKVRHAEKKMSTKHVMIFQIMEAVLIACKVFGLDHIPKHQQTFKSW